MAPRPKRSGTPATLWLDQRSLAYTRHHYPYIEQGGARHAALALGLTLEQVAKTLIMENERHEPMIVIVGGDCTVSTKALAQQIGTKKVVACTPDIAQRHSGYLVGGTSPFATRRLMPVWVDRHVLTQTLIYINGGRRGLLLALAPQVLTGALQACPVDVAHFD